MSESRNNITRADILGLGQGTSLVNTGWLRQNTPYTRDQKEAWIDSVEFEISHKGIKKLEENIKSESEYIMCFVHFHAETNDLDGIYLSVWDEKYAIDDGINSGILNEQEKEVLVNYALEELGKYREAQNEQEAQER